MTWACRTFGHVWSNMELDQNGRPLLRSCDTCGAYQHKQMHHDEWREGREPEIELTDDELRTTPRRDDDLTP